MSVFRVSIAVITLCFALGCGEKSESTTQDQPNSSGFAQQSSEETAAVVKRVDPTSVGSVAGVVKFEGEAPASKELTLGADAWCKNHYDTPPKDESLLVNDGALANAFVYVSGGLEGYEFTVPVEKKLVDQEGCIFTPRVVGVQVGQPLTMHNGDPVLHNVHSKPKENRGRNIALATKGAERDFTFKKPEVMVPVVCDVHPWMRAFVGVLEHPYYAVSAADGSFEIGFLPPGDYTVTAWHEKLGTRTAQLSVVAGESATLDGLSFAAE